MTGNRDELNEVLKAIEELFEIISDTELEHDELNEVKDLIKSCLEAL